MYSRHRINKVNILYLEQVSSGLITVTIQLSTKSLFRGWGPIGMILTEIAWSFECFQLALLNYHIHHF
jgi:hypothetical protein